MIADVDNGTSSIIGSPAISQNLRNFKRTVSSATGEVCIFGNATWYHGGRVFENTTQGRWIFQLEIVSNKWSDDSL